MSRVWGGSSGSAGSCWQGECGELSLPFVFWLDHVPLYVPSLSPRAGLERSRFMSVPLPRAWVGLVGRSLVVKSKEIQNHEQNQVGKGGAGGKLLFSIRC